MKFLVVFWGLRKTLQDAYVSRLEIKSFLRIPFGFIRFLDLGGAMSFELRFTKEHLLLLVSTEDGPCLDALLATDAWR